MQRGQQDALINVRKDVPIAVGLDAVQVYLEVEGVFSSEPLSITYTEPTERIVTVYPTAPGWHVEHAFLKFDQVG